MFRSSGISRASLASFVLWTLTLSTAQSQNYEVAEIDCAVGVGGKELLTARLRRPDGFRGTPIFADDRGSPGSDQEDYLQGHGDEDRPCHIYPDPLELSGRVFVLKVTDFSQCGVLKRDGFINVRVWFPQLAGVVMLSDQEVIIMCKPPQPTVTQSKAAGFAGSIPQGARVSGIVEERPGHLEYEVALFRETSGANGGRSVVSGSGSAFITGLDSQELPLDQAVPIGTRLQLRAKISPNSAWHHAKLMEVSVSPDPKNPGAHGSVALVKNGCRNPDLSSIIPKQPYRLKDRTNEVVLDFEAFLLSNMGERNTLWLHTQIKACMEPIDCESEVCIMDIYQPSSYGRKRRDLTMNQTAMASGSPLSKHWKSIEGPSPVKVPGPARKDGTNTEFGDNIGFSVIMPPDYYRNPAVLSSSVECRGWALATLFSLSMAGLGLLLSCLLGWRGRGRAWAKENSLYTDLPSISKGSKCESKDGDPEAGTKSRHHHHHASSNYARDPSIYRP